MSAPTQNHHRMREWAYDGLTYFGVGAIVGLTLGLVKVLGAWLGVVL
jgi:hypothetical protein